MKCHSHQYLFLGALVFTFAQKASGSRLLVILLDGFRWDYLEQDGKMLPGFQNIYQRGVKAEYMIPVYPSFSYPNFYSLMTGKTYLFFSLLDKRLTQQVFHEYLF
jgi:ectonucleotide pyrophosphatase/phosphodiesterase family protein 6